MADGLQQKPALTRSPQSAGTPGLPGDDGQAMSRPVSVVTGASSGIGEAIAHILAEQGEDLVLVARSVQELERVRAAICAAGGRHVVTVPLDLAQQDSAGILARILAEQGLSVRHLVNNAGFGLAGDMAELPVQGQIAEVDVNCRALLALTLAFLPQIRSNQGGILNVASVAAFAPGPGFAVYYATKAFVLSLTRALAFEEKGSGIRVSALCPGPVHTKFGERAGFTGSRAVALIRPLSARDVAHIGVAGYFAGLSVVVPGMITKILVLLLKILPMRLILPVLSRLQRGRRT